MKLAILFTLEVMIVSARYVLHCKMVSSVIVIIFLPKLFCQSHTHTIKVKLNIEPKSCY